MLTCPKCGLISLQGTVSCDCGYTFEPDGESHEVSPPGPSGVGGWLALLTIGVFGLGPVFAAGRIHLDFMSAEAETPLLSFLPEWGNLKIATWLAFLGFAAISFYAGWGLAKGRSWFAVRRAMIALWITGPGSNLVLGAVVPLVTMGSLPGFDVVEHLDPLIGAFVRSVIVVTLWTVYLGQSKRVRATYAKTASQVGETTSSS